MLEKKNECPTHHPFRRCRAYNSGLCIIYSALYREPVHCPYHRISRKQHKSSCEKTIARIKETKTPIDPECYRREKTKNVDQ